MENGKAVQAGVQLSSQQLEAISLDLHYAVRTFMKRPAFALTIIFIFALGTGANTAIFNLVYSTLIRQLPYTQPDRLVRLWEVENSSPQNFQMTSVSNLKDWRQRNQTLEAIAAWKRPASTTLTAQIPAEEIRAASVTANFFSVLKTNAAFGRVFLAEDELIQSNVAVVSHGFWKKNLGGRADAVGSRLELDQENYTIVGILPADFNSPAAKADVWVPMSLEVNSIDRGQNYLQIIARMKHGISVQQAQADLDAIASALEKEYPASNRRHAIALIPMQQQVTSTIRTPLIILFVTVSLVLLIACLNISNLLVVRGFDRRREFTIRMALGGSRARVMRQLLTENVLLFLAGGVAGIVLSRWILRALLLLEPQLLSDLYRTNINAGTFAFSIAISLLTGLVFGSLPAIQFRKELGMNLKERESGSAGDRFTAILRGSFVVLQIALSLALMISAGLLVQSFVAMRRVPAGFNRDQVLIAHQAIDGVKYSGSTSKSRYYRSLTAQLRQIPGVRNAAASTVIPMGEFGIDFQVPYSREDRALLEIAVSPQAYFRAVTPEYFTTLQIPILQGRSFMENEDGSGPLAVIVNEALARKRWPGQNPVGKKLRFFWADWQTYNVIGLVANTVSYGISAGTVPELFVSDAQIPYSVMNLVVRFDLLSAGSADQVRKAFLEIDPLQPVQDITTMKSLTDRSLGRERFVAFLVSAFGILAMLLASTGIYGTISFAVARRTREIGLRMALGATRFQIRNWILKQGAALIFPGILLGMAGALGAASLLQKFLFGIQAVDSVTFALSAAALCFIGMMACFFPANRAAALDPNRALHYE